MCLCLSVSLLDKSGTAVINRDFCSLISKEVGMIIALIVGNFHTSKLARKIRSCFGNAAVYPPISDDS